MGLPKNMKHITARKSSSKKATKKSAEVEYLYCGECISGLIVYPESVEDYLSSDANCTHVFEDNFEMFLRKHKDKNNRTSMKIKMKHEQRLRFAFRTNNYCCGYDARYLGETGERFYTNPERYCDKWADDLLEGYEEAGPIIAHLKDLANDSSINSKDISKESSKTVNEDLVNAAHKWVVEQLDIALGEFKEFRDGLDENERKKYDKLVEEQNEKWDDFEDGDISFEEVDVIIKEIQKKMDDIIARHNNRNKDIDSLLELIEGKKIGAIPKKENFVPRSKKKNLNKKCKDVSQKLQKARENSEQLESEACSIDVIDVKTFKEKDIRDAKPSEEKDIRYVKPSEEKCIQNVKPCEEKVISNAVPSEEKASLSDNSKMTDELMKTTETLSSIKAKLEQTENRLEEEQSKNAQLNIKLTSMFQENNLLKSKILFNDFRKYRDVLRQRQNNNFRVIEHLRASPESADTPQVQQALRSVHEFSARLILAEEQLNSEYATLCHELQTTNASQELLFDISSTEPPDLGSSYMNLLYKSVLMGQSSCAIFPLPPTTGSVGSFAKSGASATSLRPAVSSSTSFPPAGASATSFHRAISCPTSFPPAGASAASLRPVGSSPTSFPPAGASATSLRPVGSSPTSFPSAGASATSFSPSGASSTSHRQVGPTVTSFPPSGASATSLRPVGASATSLRPVGSSATCFPPSAVSVTSLGPARSPDTCFPSAGASATNANTRAGQVKHCVSSRLERGGGSVSVNSDDDSCSICFEEMNERNSFYLKLCWHRFHTVCMKQWLASPRGVSSTCPMCRTYLHKDDKFRNNGDGRRF